MTLAVITYATNLIAMVISLWMAFYLFARGYPNRVTTRAVLAFFSIAVFFLGTYNHFFTFTPDTSNLRTALLVIALSSWYSTTFATLTEDKQKRLRWMQIGIATLAAISVLFLIFSPSGIKRNEEEILYTAQLEGNFVNMLYGAAQITASAGVFFNMAVQRRYRSTNEGKYFLLASLFLVFALVYGILSIFISARLPRVIEDGLVFGSIFLLGLSVARHQSLIERRTIWQDFPVALLGISGIVIFYLAVCYWFGVPVRYFGNIAALVITSHSMYDLGREAVERWRKMEESRFRRKQHPPARLGNEALRSYLDQELILFLEIMDSPSGLIAIRQSDEFIVEATRESLPLNHTIPYIPESNEGFFRVEGNISGLTWASQAYEGKEPFILVGIGASNKKLEFSTGDLELLDEFTEQIGTLISIRKSINSENQTAAADRVAESLALPPEMDWSKMVEDALRRFSDFVSLGQSPLTERLGIREEAQVERGKQVQAALREAIQSLCPEGERPPEPLPREWYNFVVLYDAYVKGVPNREVMARLYVSEGTFHRIRRHAVRGAARYLAEKKKSSQ